ncbi:hypothetical protein [Desulfonatronum sp. SC1]|uniref:hypothetical protein n=1 Tax=Desulfonatronum sp. SC1 TaxID=2109626 RepID=UPI000D3040F8|nr:hypothetical protein [Desulfonatronum sp. SC1]PTN31931.1 hypothetical protein C6366_17275 [Desulfonatronum sp. SC1]
MRIARKNRIVGQFLILLLTLCLVGWWAYEVRSGMRFSTYPSLPEATIDRVEFPPTELRKRIPPLLESLERLPENQVLLTELDRALFLPPEVVVPDEQNSMTEDRRFEPPILSLLLLTDQRFAVLDGRALREGNVLQDGRIVRRIDQHGVVLEWPPSRSAVGGISARTERVPWTPPSRVELIRPAMRAAALEALSAYSVAPQPGMPETVQEEAP